MTMTNAERQKKYRRRAFQDPNGLLLTRVTLALGPHVNYALKDLKRQYKLSGREIVSRLLILATNGGVPDTLLRTDQDR